MARAEYQFNIDWFAPDSIQVDSFEGSGTQILEGWSAGGTTPPGIEVSTDQAYSGENSLKLTFANYNPFKFNTSGAGFSQGRFGVLGASTGLGGFQFGVAGHGFDDGLFTYSSGSGSYTPSAAYVSETLTGLTVGRTYTLGVWIKNGTDAVSVELGVSGFLSNPSSLVVADWQQLTVEFTASTTAQEITLATVTNPTTVSSIVYMDYLTVTVPENDVTNDVLIQSDITWTYGRDYANAFTTPLDPAQTSLNLFNGADRSYKYMPMNPTSPLYPHAGPGKSISIGATYSDRYYPLFQGFVDEYEIDASHGAQYAALTAQDILGTLGNKILSTGLYKNLQSGDVVNLILDEINWPAEKRDVDQGATTVRFWWAENTSALEALQDIVKSEGNPAIFYLKPTGIAVFRSRHHRMVDPSVVGQTIAWDNV